MTDSEPTSLEFIEDSYLPTIDLVTATPSLDDTNALILNNNNYKTNIPPTAAASDLDYCDLETENYLHNLSLDDVFYIDLDSDYANTLELQTVETEFIAAKIAAAAAQQKNTSSLTQRLRFKFFEKRTMREVKVTFIDFSKPYLAKISSNDNYKKFLSIGDATGRDISTNVTSPTSPAASIASADIVAEFAALSVEEQDQQRAKWSEELATVEHEINSLREVLASKTRHASDLKRKLGITVWKELTDDMSHGLKNVKESTVYQTVEQSVGNFTKAVHDAPIFQRTESVLKTTSEKTASVFGSITSGITSKFSQMKNSESMRSIEEKVGSAYENVKGKVSSRSGSVSSFPDALDEETPISGLHLPIDSKK